MKETKSTQAERNIRKKDETNTNRERRKNRGIIIKEAAYESHVR